MEELIKEYVKENNIIGYLNYGIDYNNLKEILIKNTTLRTDDELEDEIYRMIQEYNYNLAIETGDTNEIIKYIYGCEFDIEINKDGKIDLIDLPNVYLGGKDSYENFETIMGASGRLEGSFYRDYYGMEIY